MSARRYESPDQLLGATAFAKHRHLNGSLNLVRLLKGQGWLDRPLADGCKVPHSWGRRRKPGRWELAMVAFTASRQVAIQPWYDETTDALWQECGFPSKPPYERVWQRLRELEDNPEPWIEAIGRLIQRARRHDPRVAAHVHVDSTEDETLRPPAAKPPAGHPPADRPSAHHQPARHPAADRWPAAQSAAPTSPPSAATVQPGRRPPLPPQHGRIATGRPKRFKND
jgi:hypothetical protein